MNKAMAAFLAFALALTGCDGGGGGDDARIRLIQASHPGGVLSLFLNGELIDSAAYGQATGYDDVDDDDAATLSGVVGTDTVFSTPVNLDDDIDYSIVTVQQGGVTTPIIFVDDNSAPSLGNARLRVIHALPGAGGVDVYALREGEVVTNHAPNFTNLNFSEASRYDQLDRNEYVIWVTQAGTKNVLASAASRDLKNLENWTAVVHQDADGSGVTVSVFRDQEGDELNL